MIRSTFFGFNTALSGLYANQKALDITGQNLTNMKTEGYTRQRLDTYSSRSANGYGLYAGGQSTAVGNGVMMRGVEQVRDPFLDIRFRREACDLGEVDAKLGALDELGYIFDDTMKKGLDTQVEDMIAQLQAMSSNPGNKQLDSVVRASADALANLLNGYAKEVAKAREQQDYQLNKVDIANVNNIMKNIANINKSIKESDIAGNPGLELRDERNLLIDELSTYMKIDVKYSQVEIASDRYIEGIEINFVGNSGNVQLVKDDYHNEFAVSKMADGTTIITAGDKVSSAQATIDLANDLMGKLKKCSGELQAAIDAGDAGKIATLSGQQSALHNELYNVIPCDGAHSNAPYKEWFTGGPGNPVDVFAGKLSVGKDADGNETIMFTPDDGTPAQDITEQVRLLPPGGEGDVPLEFGSGILKGRLDMLNKSAIFDGGGETIKGIGYYEKMMDTIASKLAEVFNAANDPDNIDGVNGNGIDDNPLFQARGDAAGKITAANITIADGWKNNDYGITISKNENPGEAPPGSGDNSGASDNIVKMISLFKNKIDFMTEDGVKIFNGNFQDCLGDVCNNLALDTNTTTKLVKNHVLLISGIDDSRASISGVSMDEEGMNLMKFQKAYNAAARLMTTLDEAVDTIISKMGIVGR